MNRLLLPISLAMTFVLTGCSPSIPDCGDAKTTSAVNDLVLETLLGDETKNLSDMFKVELGAVQTVEHSKDPEKYTCKAEVKVSTTGKLGELFGNADNILALTHLQNGTLIAAELKRLDEAGQYKALAGHLLKPALAYLNGNEKFFEKLPPQVG